MVSEAGYSLQESDLPEIPAKIAKFNATLGNQFKRASRVNPPYTEAEEADFYRRQNAGPLTVYRSIADRKAPTSPKKPRRSPPAAK
jgi:hypothetical protein